MNIVLVLGINDRHIAPGNIGMHLPILCRFFAILLEEQMSPGLIQIVLLSALRPYKKKSMAKVLSSAVTHTRRFKESLLAR